MRPVFLLAFVIPVVALAQGRAEKAGPRSLPPFLEEFKVAEIPVARNEVTIPTALGPLRGFVARPATTEALPAVLMLGASGLDENLKRHVADLAGVGYVVLAVDLKKQESERALTQTSAALRWLKRRGDLTRDQLGVVGWGWGGEQALAVAAEARLQGCVVVDPTSLGDRRLLPGLRGTQVLALFAGLEKDTQPLLKDIRGLLSEFHVPHKIHIYEGARAGFMEAKEGDASFDIAEKAWVEMYEFLGKHVEDAGETPTVATDAKMLSSSNLTIADIMRSVNSASGVRGALMQAVRTEPASDKDWRQVRSQAALIAEAGRMLERRTPPKDANNHWRQQAAKFVAIADMLVSNAEQKNYAEVTRTLEQLSLRCAECHRRHR